MKSLDWLDIAIHGGIGAAAGILAVVSGAWPIVVLNALVWLARELFQHSPNLAAPLGGSAQSTLEWIVPTAACCLVAGIGWAVR